ncbi:protein O-mannosyl-transferase Tmtc3-like isoform X1 [Amphibalanus amphitrite]|uniref:protein O-mannosyl-transferase Tmtc3-like isoform X1 n=2 Tax=Amphibalanus amphitrite TaxID=1232801 RepID=UPI001C92283A|nr:protein O-mannosyl-transferase Tmtc3-like isoform X1 [Amphibalanus amphitrite]XP_043246024.1 protein O-mannosyl-transferase Tmtc3-like isoform X1 [Amphibalanus amphitrite]
MSAQGRTVWRRGLVRSLRSCLRRNAMLRRWVYYGCLTAAVALCYYNALQCDFVFDDVSAVKDNRDLRPHTPLSNLLYNDFWGTPMEKEQSHKSYRPLCVLTFRWNYLLHQLRPMGYHLVNVALHALVCALFFRMCVMFVSELTSFLAALLFAVHPIHTEAVTGVVGRAELLSSVFFLAAFMAYARAASARQTTDWRWLGTTVLCITAAMLCKEQGITVVGVCGVYEVFVVRKLRLNSLRAAVAGLSRAGKAQPPDWLGATVGRLATLAVATLCLLIGRVKIMGAQLPVFTRFDNPASTSDTATRWLTYNYLLGLNTALLLAPEPLCCDWTMGTVPLLTSIGDPRNLATLATYAGLALLVWRALASEDRGSDVVIMSLALVALPFLPASNLFFPVGFVVAERVLYMPSMGFCLLVAAGCQRLVQTGRHRTAVWLGMSVLLISHGLKTHWRNWDWRDEYSIFTAGLRVNRNNAKLYNNVGHALEGRQEYERALVFFQHAVRVQEDDIGAHINVGRTYTSLHMYDKAEQAYRTAKSLLPRARPGQVYQARIAPNHLNVFLNLANLLARNHSRLEEADALYRQAIGMRADYTQAYINRGDVLIKLNRTQEARRVYETALTYDSHNPDIYYNLGVVCLEQGLQAEAQAYLDRALEHDPDHQQALLNSAVIIQEEGPPERRPLAYQRLHRLIALRPSAVGLDRVYFNLGMLAMDDHDLVPAEAWLKKAVEVRPEFRSALFNLALLLSDAGRPLEAVPFLTRLVQHHPDHVKALILLGDIYINNIEDLDEAQKCYEQILRVDPDHVQGLHNLCVVHVKRDDLERAQQCLERAARLAPDEDYIQRHLQIVRARRQAAKSATRRPEPGA